MARAKLARPSQVLCTRAPAELADRVRALASSSGQRVSAILREALLQRSGITPKVQAAVVEALLAGAEERLDLAEVAGVLLAEATSHQEERFIAKVATELQEAIDETTKAPKAPKLPKMLTGTGFTKFEHEVLVEFADSKSINEIQEKKTLLLHSAISATDESFVRKAARAAIAANQAAVKAQKKALPKPPKAKHVKEPRPRKLPQAKTAKKPPARPLAGEAPKLQKVLIFYPIAGKAGQPSKTVAIEIQAPVGARLSRMMGIAREKTGINFERRQSKAPTEVQTDEGIFYRGGRPLYTSDGFEAHDIEFKTWEALEKEEFTEAQKRFKKSPIQPLPAVPKKEPLGMVAKVEARAAKEKGKAAKLKAMRDEHAEACQGRRDTIEERKAISSPLAFRVGVTARPKEAALLSYAQMIAEARARGESRGDIRDEEKAAELALEAIYEREGQGGTMKEYKKKATQHHKQAAEYYNQPRSVHNIQEAYLNQAYGWAYAKLGSKRASPKGPTVKDLEAQVKKYAEIKRGEISTGEERKALPSVWEDQAEHWNNKIDSQPTREDLDILEGAILRATPPTKDLSRMMGRIAQRRAEMHAQEEHLSKLRADAAKPKTETAGQRYERERKKKALYKEAEKAKEAKAREEAKARAEADKAEAKRAKERADLQKKNEAHAARLAKEEKKLEENCGETCDYRLQGAKCSIKAGLLVGAKEGGVLSTPARYCLLEIDQLKPSNNPLRGYSRTPGFPRDAQERDYERERLEQAKVQKIADRFEPSLVFNTSPGAIDGLPIANEEGFILGGNGRTMATILVYGGESKSREVDGERLKGYLRENAHLFGFTKEQVRQYQKPMIVRTIRTQEGGPGELAQWSRRLNQTMSQELSPTLLAVSRAKFLKPSALSELAYLSPDETIASWLSSQGSRSFVKGLLDSDIIDTRNSATYILPSGLLSPDGRDLVNDLLVAVLVPDAHLIKALGPQVTATVGKAAPYLAQLGGLGKYNVLPQFTLALRDFTTLATMENTDPARFLAHDAFFGLGPKSKGDPIAETWLHILYALQASPAKMAKLARHYLQLAKAPAEGQMGLMAAESFEPLQALQHAAKAQGVKL